MRGSGEWYRTRSDDELRCLVDGNMPGAPAQTPLALSSIAEKEAGG